MLDLNTPPAMPGDRAFRRAIVGMAMLTTMALAIVFAVSPIPSQARNSATDGGGMLVGKF